jgi:hypothetical protein
MCSGKYLICFLWALLNLLKAFPVFLYAQVQNFNIHEYDFSLSLKCFYCGLIYVVDWIQDINGNKMINQYVRERKIGTGSYGKVVRPVVLVAH